MNRSISVHLLSLRFCNTFVLYPPDLLRCESMNSLDPAACARILNKRYSLLISMAPLSNEIRPLASCTPPHLGPAIPEVLLLLLIF